MGERQTRATIIGIIEDDVDVSRGLTSVLRAARYDAVTYESAESFLSSSDRSRVSLLVVDFRLPGMTGLQLQRTLRDEASIIPIISISAHASESLQRSILDNGAAAFLGKPVRGNILVAEVERVLSPPNIGDQRDPFP